MSNLPNPRNAFPSDGNGHPVAVLYGIRPDTHVPGMTDTYFPVDVDPISTGLVVVDESHDKIHDGLAFSATRTPTLSNNAEMRFKIQTPSGLSYAHMLIGFSVGQQTHVALYENPTNVTGGDVLPIFNRNRNSATTPGLSIRHSVSATKDGVLVWEQVAGSGGSTWGQSRADAEMILKSDTAYIVGITNMAAGIDYLNINFTWYETSNT